MAFGRPFIVASVCALASCAGGGGDADAGPADGGAEAETLDAVFEKDGVAIEGAVLDLGAHDPALGPLVTSMAIRNRSDAPFEILSEPPLLVGGVDADAFTVSMQIANPVIAPGEAAPFSLSYAPRAGGEHEGSLLFAYGVETHERMQLSLRAESEGAGDENGVRYALFDGSFSLVPDFEALEPAETGVVPTFELTPRAPTPAEGDMFAFEFTGEIAIATAGNYTFHVTSDDGAMLWIDDVVVVDNNGLHAVRTVAGARELTAGRHPIRVGYFDSQFDAILQVEWEGPGVARAIVPTDVLFH